MAFLLDGKTIQQGVAFTDAEGNQYPANWLNLSSAEEKEAIGLTEVADPEIFDNRFYWDTDLPKALEDKLEEDGSTTKGLKTQFVAQVKDTAGKLLNATDWYVIRKAERNVEVPSEIALKRTQVVAEANRLEVGIKASSTVEALIEVLNAQNWSE